MAKTTRQFELFLMDQALKQQVVDYQRIFNDIMQVPMQRAPAFYAPSEMTWKREETSKAFGQASRELSLASGGVSAALPETVRTLLENIHKAWAEHGRTLIAQELARGRSVAKANAETKALLARFVESKCDTTLEGTSQRGRAWPHDGTDEDGNRASWEQGIIPSIRSGAQEDGQVRTDHHGTGGGGTQAHREGRFGIVEWQECWCIERGSDCVSGDGQDVGDRETAVLSAGD